MDDILMVKHLIRDIGRLLHGKPPAVQGAALADLLAIWLAGHVTPDKSETERLREQMLGEHIRTVRLLIAEYAKAIGQPH